MKCLLILLVVFVATNAKVLTKKNNLRISEGLPPQKGETLDFCYMNVNFYEKQKTCGCSILFDSWILTSARCVYDCSEKEASNITVYFPFKTGNDAAIKITRIRIPDSPVVYEPAMDTPYLTIAPNNLAMLQLPREIILDDGKASSSEYLYFETSADVIALIDQTYKFRACGVGSTNNKGEKSKGVVCTDVQIVADASCKKYGTVSDVHTVPAGMVCVQWSNKDNNVCVGDFGGPIYAYKTDAKGKINEEKVLGYAVGSPDVRPNAPCLDGHTVFAQLITEGLYIWID